jgi:hypothetical protein
MSSTSEPVGPARPRTNKENTFPDQNLLATLTITRGQRSRFEPGPLANRVRVEARNNLHQLLSAAEGPGIPGTGALLWTYTKDKDGSIVINFGKDDYLVSGRLESNKSGHAGFTSLANIAGEIRSQEGRWVIDNNSGAWGSRPDANRIGQGGKSRMLRQVATLIRENQNINVTAQPAYSRDLHKREEQVRYERQKGRSRGIGYLQYRFFKKLFP